MPQPQAAAPALARLWGSAVVHVGSSCKRNACTLHVLVPDGRPARRFIVMEADTTPTPWSKICVSHADCILLVGAGTAHPEVGPAASLLRV